jgi:flagellar assembly protein FliH
MKSSNNLIRVSENQGALTEWLPPEFENFGANGEELIRFNTATLFGLTSSNGKEGQSAGLKRLFKAEQLGVIPQQWTPQEMGSNYSSIKMDLPKPWEPFVEKENPQVKVRKILEQAEIQANEIIHKAEMAAEQIRQEAHESGIEEAKNEMRESLQAACSVIQVARDWRTDMMSQSEPMVLDLIKKMAQKMFGNGMILDGDTLQRHFAEVLESARSLGDLRIFMHPLDAQALGHDWREYQASVMGAKVELVSNESIRRGGCYIQGEWGTADALVETQLNAILEQFSEVEQPERREEE